MIEPISITDLARFTDHEREMTTEILLAWNEQGLPEKFIADQIEVYLNTYTGGVFIMNRVGQIAMVEKGKLEQYYEDYRYLIAHKDVFWKDLSTAKQQEAIKNNQKLWSKHND